MNCEEINPYDSRRAKGEQVKEMFDSIAPAYDFMNRAMTLGIDRLWRRKAISLIEAMPHDRILDVATGTADLAILMAEKLDPLEVIGVDISEEMLAAGSRKAEDAGVTDVVKLSPGDCLNLPLTDDSFDVVTSAFGVRNFENLLEGYREMHRVLRKGGSVVVLELSVPTSKWVAPLYRFYTRRIIPAVGRLISRDKRAYSYLPESIEAVPQRQDMIAIMHRAGFHGGRFIPLTFGVATLYIAEK